MSRVKNNKKTESQSGCDIEQAKLWFFIDITTAKECSEGTAFLILESMSSTMYYTIRQLCFCFCVSVF